MADAQKRLARERLQLDGKLAQVGRAFELALPPRSGWLKAVRRSLGMSTAQLGKRIGISQPAAFQLEVNEVRRTVTLQSLERAAGAMGCTLVYAIVPERSLEAFVDDRAQRVARRKLARVGHSMALEAQSPPAAIDELQVSELARDLKERLGRELWDEP